MKYRYYVSAVQCNRYNSNLKGIEDIRINVLMNFITDKEPMKRNIDEIIKTIESTRDDESLPVYYTDVDFIKANRIKQINKKERDFTR